MSAIGSAIETLFADPNLSREASYRDGGTGAALLVRVVARRPDQIIGFRQWRQELTQPPLLDDRPGNDGTFAIAVHRLAHPLQRMGVPLVPRIMSEWAHHRSASADVILSIVSSCVRVCLHFINCLLSNLVRFG